MNPQPSRRELLAFGWLPFFRAKHISMAGARFRILRNGHSRRRYLVIHGNEESAREVLVRHMETHEGIAYVIEGHARNVEVEGLRLDPNRMFSRIGAEASLKSPSRRRSASARSLSRWPAASFWMSAR